MFPSFQKFFCYLNFSDIVSSCFLCNFCECGKIHIDHDRNQGNNYFVITGIEKCKEPDEIFAHCEKAVEHRFQYLQGGNKEKIRG